MEICCKALYIFQQVCEYNVPHGKKNRGLTVVSSYRSLVGDKVNEEDLKCAEVIGWAIEFVSVILQSENMFIL